MADQEINKKTLADYQGYYEYFTQKASDIKRNLGFAGIAVIWIFKTTAVGGSLGIPESLIWTFYFRWKEWQINNGKISADSDLRAHKYLPLPIHFFFWAKLVLLVFAYILLFRFLYIHF